jgi:hypothetical protein
MIKIPGNIQRIESPVTRALACRDHIKQLMKEIGEDYYYRVHFEEIFPRIQISYVGKEYMTINYIRHEDEYLIDLLKAVSRRQSRLL